MAGRSFNRDCREINPSFQLSEQSSEKGNLAESVLKETRRVEEGARD